MLVTSQLQDLIQTLVREGPVTSQILNILKLLYTHTCTHIYTRTFMHIHIYISPAYFIVLNGRVNLGYLIYPYRKQDLDGIF